MAALLNPMYRRLAVVTCRRISTPAAEKLLLPLVYQRTFQDTIPVWWMRVEDSQMLASTRRYYVFGGKGGAVKFANDGEPALIASTELSRSLGDLFEQDRSDGKTVRVDGFDSLFAVEIGHVKMGKPQDVGSYINNLLEKMGLETHSDIMSTLNEMLGAIPPGLEEAFVLSELIKSIEGQGPDKLRHIVPDAPSTGHTHELLSTSVWIEKFLVLSIKCARLEELRKQIARVREILFDPQSTEFIIVTIPTMMAVSESSRFRASLKKDGVHARRLTKIRCCLHLHPTADSVLQNGGFRKKHVPSVLEDRELGGLKLIQAQLLDMEVKGVPALRILSDSVWK